jgi:hypothetical protein
LSAAPHARAVYRRAAARNAAAIDIPARITRTDAAFTTQRGTHTIRLQRAAPSRTSNACAVNALTQSPFDRQA